MPDYRVVSAGLSSDNSAPTATVRAMWLKIIIVLLFIGNLVALGSALYTLLVDQGRGGKRTARMLLVRVSLAALLLLLIAYGFWSGDLGLNAPWSAVHAA